MQSISKIENKKSLKRYKTGLLKKVIVFFIAILFIVLERMFYPYFETWENDLITSIQNGPGPSLGIVNQAPANDWLQFNGALGELNYIFLISSLSNQPWLGLRVLYLNPFQITVYFYEQITLL